MQRVWEPEFDYADDELRALAATDWRLITSHQLSCYYVLNLVYHDSLQPELFRYLFPLCLAEWHESVMLSSEKGDYLAENLLMALRRPYLWRQMMDAGQRRQVRAFLTETMLCRIDSQRGFDSQMTWLPVWNALGGTAPIMRALWQQWWSLTSPGKAICALQYAAHLIYPPEHNPLWPAGRGTFCYPLSCSEAWTAENLEFLRKELVPETLLINVRKAARLLHNEPEAGLAERIARDAKAAGEIIEIQVEELLNGLASDSRGQALE